MAGAAAMGPCRPLQQRAIRRCRHAENQVVGILAAATITALIAPAAMAEALTLRFAMITADTFPYMDGAGSSKS